MLGFKGCIYPQKTKRIVDFCGLEAILKPPLKSQFFYPMTDPWDEDVFVYLLIYHKNSLSQWTLKKKVWTAYFPY